MRRCLSRLSVIRRLICRPSCSPSGDCRPRRSATALGATYYSQGEQSHAEFYEALGRGERLTLNGVTSEDWESVFLAAAEGHDEGVICLCQAFGSSSPSFDSAEYASRRMTHFHEIEVRVHQTPRSTAAQAAIALALARVAQNGGDREAVERALDEATASADIFMIAPDVDGLDRAGELAAVQSQSGIGSLDFGVPVFRARDRIKAVELADDAEQAEDALLESRRADSRWTAGDPGRYPCARAGIGGAAARESVGAAGGRRDSRDGAGSDGRRTVGRRSLGAWLLSGAVSSVGIALGGRERHRAAVMTSRSPLERVGPPLPPASPPARGREDCGKEASCQSPV